MKLSIIIIGDEILIGQVTDTNSGAIARTFGPLGWDIASVRTVADNAADIRSAVANALVESELVICTGASARQKTTLPNTHSPEFSEGKWCAMHPSPPT